MPGGESLLRLLARPDAFDGKEVRVEGFLRPHPGGGAGLYLYPEHAAHRVTPNGVWLDLPGDTDDGGGGSVQVIGTFRAGTPGWGGVIEAVTYLKADTPDPRRQHLERVSRRREWLRVRRRGVACPHCGNAESIRDMGTTTRFAPYFICNRCGRSFVPAQVKHGE